MRVKIAFDTQIVKFNPVENTQKILFSGIIFTTACHSGIDEFIPVV